MLFGTRIVVPKNLEAETLSKIHYGHQGIHHCRQRVSLAVWWPGVAKQVETFAKSCPVFEDHTPPTQPLLQIPLPSHPWEKVAADLLELKNTTYLLVVDYYSRFVEVQKLTSTTSMNVIAALKSIFSLHRIPLTFMSGNGPQFVSEIRQSYGFVHVTSSPYHTQSNGLAERTVKTVKHLLENSQDIHSALSTYRATPMPWCGLSPAELLMGCRVCTDVPQIKHLFIHKWPYLKNFRRLDQKLKALL